MAYVINVEKKRIEKIIRRANKVFNIQERLTAMTLIKIEYNYRKVRRL